MHRLKLFYSLFLLISIQCVGIPLADAAITTVPAKPTLSVLQNWTEGGYDIQWNKWSGTDASRWLLLENGKVIYTANLTASSDGQQSGSFAVRNPRYGVYSYQVILSNQAGETRSDVKYYAVDGASWIVSDVIDQSSQALQVTLDQSTPLDIPIRVIGATTISLSLSTNHSGIFSYELVQPNVVRLKGLQAGRASLLIRDAKTGYTRFLGIRVRNLDGSLPSLPSYIAMGSVSEDTDGDLNFWKQFANGDNNRWVDIRYIYINGGPKNQGVGWRTWTSRDGFRVTSYVRESLKLGMIPFLVYYNIPDGGESYYTDKQHLQDPSYMEGYFTDLKFALDLARDEAQDEIVGIILEPDALGYFSQNQEQPDQLFSQTSSAYRAGVLNGNDPIFPDTLKGTVQAINYIIRKYLPQAYFGWQANLWASPPGGFTTRVPGNGIVHLTDTMGIDKGRQAILREASAIADYYIKAGILSYGANFISIDKYGLDAGAEGKWDNPALSLWFWNAIHWTNYLEFVKALHIKTKLPVILWQLPVGRINNSLADNPYTTDRKFPPLTNTTGKFEDSAPVYFLGDQFTTDGQRLAFFSQDDAISHVTVSGNTVTWESHMDLARKAGINAILFGAGVGHSTDGVGSPPTENYWWITKIQRYFRNPMPICTVTQDCATEQDLPPDNGGEEGGGGDGQEGTIKNFPSNLAYHQTKDTGWVTGAQFNATLTNQGQTALSNIRIKFEVPPSTIQIWNVDVIASDSQSVTIGLPGWKTALLPGEVFSLGFVIQPEIEPSVNFISMTQQ